MKRLLFTLAISALVLSVAPQTKSQDVSVDFFYNNLSGGNWLEVDQYGYCWQPDVAVNDPSWRPYSDGYWAYTDAGWTWISYEDFGWATYHYGRWVKLADYGWVWVPGADLEWGPAWVSWRTGGDYIGWAPLPPSGPGIVYEGQPIGGAVDIEFDIGPEFFNFCDIRFIGEPVLRERIVDVRQNVTLINQTVNVTNITVKNNTVFNSGPDINVVNQHSSRPIQRLHLERQANVDVASAAKSGAITKVQGNNLVVAAPMKISKPAQPVAPPTVKAKVSQAKIEKGWAGVNPNEQAKLRQKIKTEDRTKIPPPTGAGAAATGRAAAGASPAASAAPTTAASPVEQGKHRGKAAQRLQPGATASPAGALASPAASPAIPERGKHRGRAAEQVQPGATVSPRETSPGLAPERERGARGRHGEQLGATPPTAPTAGPEGMTAPEGRRKGLERGNVGPSPTGAGSPRENLNETRGRYRHEEQPAMSPTSPQGGQPGTQGAPPGAQGGPASEAPAKHKAEGVGAPPTGASPAGAAREHKREERGKTERGSPVPTP